MKNLKKLWSILFLTITVFLIPFFSYEGHAQQSEWSEFEHVDARLIHAFSEKEAGILAGLHFKIEDKWKIYWRHPGQSGFPPFFDWSESTNIKKIELNWPIPKRFFVGDLYSYGYEKEIIIPLSITPIDPNKQIDLKVDMEVLQCGNVCLPFRGKLSLTINPHISDADNLKLIKPYLSQVPQKGSETKLSITSAELSNNRLFIKGNIKDIKSFDPSKFDIFVETPSDIILSAPRIFYFDRHTRFEARFSSDNILDEKENILGKNIPITLSYPGQALEKSVIVQEKQSNHIQILYYLFFAFIGGIILNCMPCVLPVLSIKILSIIQQKGSDKKEIRSGFLASTLGILFSFFILALVIISFRYLGVSIGWGAQFREPLFLVFLCLILTFFASSLWGFFEFRLPQKINQLALTSEQKKQGFWGHFLTGAFATLLATPCTAPFMGAAVSFALTHGAFEILIIFLTIGLGLSFPYLLVGFFPKAFKYFPKPGQWMIRLKWFMGVLLFGTVLWLVAVIETQISLLASIILISLYVLIILIIALPILTLKSKKLRMTLIVLVSLMTFAVPLVLNETKHKNDYSSFWQPFELSKIPEYIQQDKIVYVTVTADWCITCKVNEFVALRKEGVVEFLSSDRAVAMRADWTKRDRYIADYLKKFDVYGIPFNVIYDKEHPNGAVLPQILSSSDLLRHHASH